VNAKLPERVHLVRNVGLDTAQEVFRTVGLGCRLRRVPDGEPGPRRLWISFQYPLPRSSPFLRPDPSGGAQDVRLSASRTSPVWRGISGNRRWY
jgi:hypothetical protein